MPNSKAQPAGSRVTPQLRHLARSRTSIVQDIFSLAPRSYTSSVVGERQEKRGKTHKTSSSWKHRRCAIECAGKIQELRRMLGRSWHPSAGMSLDLASFPADREQEAHGVSENLVSLRRRKSTRLSGFAYPCPQTTPHRR